MAEGFALQGGLLRDHLQRRFETERRDIEERHVGPARARLAALEADLARAREGLQASKQQMVAAIRISRLEHDQIAVIPESDRSVAQHISVLVWGMMEEVRKSRDDALCDAEALRHDEEGQGAAQGRRG